MLDDDFMDSGRREVREGTKQNRPSRVIDGTEAMEHQRTVIIGARESARNYVDKQ